MWANYSTDQNKFTGHMFNIKLEEKSQKMSVKVLPVKIQKSKNRQLGQLGLKKLFCINIFTHNTYKCKSLMSQDIICLVCLGVELKHGIN